MFQTSPKSCIIYQKEVIHSLFVAPPTPIFKKGSLMKLLHVVYLMIMVLVFSLLMAAAPLQVVDPPPPVPEVLPGTSITEAILALALGFATLIGTGGLAAALVNIGKVFKLVADGRSGQAYAFVSFLLFSALVYFHIFRGIDLQVLDTIAAQLAGILIFLGGLFMQMGAGQYVYDILVKLKIPFIGMSFSAANAAKVPRPV